jgi:ABC-2 type transport system ATP-binding protein
MILDLRSRGKTVILCSHRLDDVQNVCDRVAVLHEGELQKLGRVSTLLEDVSRLEIEASGVALTDELRRDLEAVLQRHGGRLEVIGHRSTTLEELFLRIVAEAKAHPGRRHLPEGDKPDGNTAPAQ